MTAEDISIEPAGAADLPAVMKVMQDSFDPRFGEAWTAPQCAGLLPLPGVWLTVARGAEGTVGFALARLVLDEAELLLLAVRRSAQGRGIGKLLLAHFEKVAKEGGARRLHLEVRDGNSARRLYERAGYVLVARRIDYYKGRDGYCYDALTLAKAGTTPG
ncbi:MAG: GNAT family N-acetyltransferase [Pseudomonadota bacterium]|nr:GNAT family N-acetyltransferase [Pseudomonadota bacterium]